MSDSDFIDMVLAFDEHVTHRRRAVGIWMTVLNAMQ